MNINTNIDQPIQYTLLRQCIYALQGVSDGEHVLFYTASHSQSVENSNPTGDRMEGVICIPQHSWSLHQRQQPTSSIDEDKDRAVLQQAHNDESILNQFTSQTLFCSPDALMICGTVGVYVRCIQRYIYNKTTSTNNTSSIRRAFTCVLKNELQIYFTFLSNILFESSTKEQHNLFTIPDLLYQVYPYILRLKTLAMIVSMVRTSTEVTAENHGIELLSHLHRHLLHHGNISMHVPLLTNILQSTIKPWFDMLYRWTMDGLLLLQNEMESEFFISFQPNVPDRDLWRKGYVIHHNRIPMGIFDAVSAEHHPSSEQTVIELILMIGKGVNYIRRCLHDTEWSLLPQLLLCMQSKKGNDVQDCFSDNVVLTTQDRMQLLGFSYESIKDTSMVPTSSSQSVLWSTIENSATLVHTHILSYLRTEFSFIQHIYALKQFLLFGQGDFYCTLMDGVHAEYEQKHSSTGIGVIGIYRHTLANIVESSIKSTNANNFPNNILERLQVELLLDSSHDGNYMFALPKGSGKQYVKDTSTDQRTVWDIFVLTYVVPDPIVSIVHDDAMKIYQTIFIFLFRMNHIDYRLNLTWRQSAMLQHALHTNAQHLGIAALSNFAYQQAIQLLRQISMTRQAMVHFITNLKSYIMFEVIERSWKRLIPIVKTARTLDEIIQAHDRYLKEVTVQSLLTSTSQTLYEDFGLAGKLEILLLLVKDFCSYQEVLFGEALDAADRALQKRREAEFLAKKGSWGFHREREAAEQETCFGLSDTPKLIELDTLAQEFNTQMASFLQLLDMKLNGCPAPIGKKQSETTTPTTPQLNTNPTDNEIDSEIDLDSLRFLASQLNHNKFYGVTNF
jgi:gamma-tubulin complex component 3